MRATSFVATHEWIERGANRETFLIHDEPLASGDGEKHDKGTQHIGGASASVQLVLRSNRRVCRPL